MYQEQMIRQLYEDLVGQKLDDAARTKREEEQDELAQEILRLTQQCVRLSELASAEEEGALYEPATAAERKARSEKDKRILQLEEDEYEAEADTDEAEHDWAVVSQELAEEKLTPGPDGYENRRMRTSHRKDRYGQRAGRLGDVPAPPPAAPAETAGKPEATPQSGGQRNEAEQQAAHP